MDDATVNQTPLTAHEMLIKRMVLIKKYKEEKRIKDNVISKNVSYFIGSK